MVVHHIKMHNICTSFKNAFNIRSKPCKISRQNRWGNQKRLGHNHSQQLNGMVYHTKNRIFVPMFDVIGTILLTTNLTFYESFKSLLLFAVACHHHDFSLMATVLKPASTNKISPVIPLAQGDNKTAQHYPLLLG